MSEFEVTENENERIVSDFNEFEEEQVAELEDTDDWGNYLILILFNYLLSLFYLIYLLFYFLATAWQECKELGLKWGGRGMGGRATGRMTVQTKDVVVEGCTMAYLGTNLLERTTLRLLQGRKYGLIGRNGVGKRYFKLN